MMEYLQTDWAAMTLNDWIGTIVTVVIFILMIWAYVYTFHPKNKEKLESRRHIPLDDDNDAEDSK
ncbi:MAG: cbb3-type cytochrome oxidase subunit 3 [Gammaproteobacteria bacterium]